MTQPNPEPTAFIGIGSIRDAANQAQITVALDCDGLVRMRCLALDGSGRECETELTRDEAHALAHACTTPSPGPQHRSERTRTYN